MSFAGPVPRAAASPLPRPRPSSSTYSSRQQQPHKRSQEDAQSDASSLSCLQSRPLLARSQQFPSQQAAWEHQQREATAQSFLAALLQAQREEAERRVEQMEGGGEANIGSDPSSPLPPVLSSLSALSAHESALLASARQRLEAALGGRRQRQPAPAGFHLGPIQGLGTTSVERERRRSAQRSPHRSTAPSVNVAVQPLPHARFSSSTAAVSTVLTQRSHRSQQEARQRPASSRPYFNSTLLEQDLQQLAEQRAQRTQQLAQPKYTPTSKLQRNIHITTGYASASLAASRPTSAVPQNGYGSASASLSLPSTRPASRPLTAAVAGSPSAAASSLAHASPRASPRPASSPAHSLHSVTSQQRLAEGSTASPSSPSTPTPLASFEYTSFLPRSLMSSTARSQQILPLRPVENMTLEEKQGHVAMLEAAYAKLVTEMMQAEEEALREGADAREPTGEQTGEEGEEEPLAFSHPLSPSSSLPLHPPIPLSPDRSRPPTTPTREGELSPTGAQPPHATLSTIPSTASLASSASGYFRPAPSGPVPAHLIRWHSGWWGQWTLEAEVETHSTMQAAEGATVAAAAVAAASPSLSPNSFPRFIRSLPSSLSLRTMHSLKHTFHPLSMWHHILDGDPLGVEWVKEMWFYLGNNERFISPEPGQPPPEDPATAQLLQPLYAIVPHEHPSSQHLRSLFYEAWSKHLPLSSCEFWLPSSSSSGQPVDLFQVSEERRRLQSHHRLLAAARRQGQPAPASAPETRLRYHRVLVGELVEQLGRLLHDHEFFRGREACSRLIGTICTPWRTAGGREQLKGLSSPSDTCMDFDLFHAFILALLILSIGTDTNHGPPHAYEEQAHQREQEAEEGDEEPALSPSFSPISTLQPVPEDSLLLPEAASSDRLHAESEEAEENEEDEDDESDTWSGPANLFAAMLEQPSEEEGDRRKQEEEGEEENKQEASPRSEPPSSLSSLPSSPVAASRVQHESLALSLERLVWMFRSLMLHIAPALHAWVEERLDEEQSAAKEEKQPLKLEQGKEEGAAAASTSTALVPSTASPPALASSTLSSPVGTRTGKFSTPLSRQGYTHGHAQMMRALSPSHSTASLKQALDGSRPVSGASTSSTRSRLPTHLLRTPMFEQSSIDCHVLDQEAVLLSMSGGGASPIKKQTGLPIPPPSLTLAAPDPDGIYRHGVASEAQYARPPFEEKEARRHGAAPAASHPALSPEPAPALRAHMRTSKEVAPSLGGAGIAYPSKPPKPGAQEAGMKRKKQADGRKQQEERGNMNRQQREDSKPNMEERKEPVPTKVARPGSALPSSSSRPAPSPSLQHSASTGQLTRLGALLYAVPAQPYPSSSLSAGQGGPQGTVTQGWGALPGASSSEKGARRRRWNDFYVSSPSKPRSKAAHPLNMDAGETGSTFKASWAGDYASVAAAIRRHARPGLHAEPLVRGAASDLDDRTFLLRAHHPSSSPDPNREKRRSDLSHDVDTGARAQEARRLGAEKKKLDRREHDALRQAGQVSQEEWSQELVRRHSPSRRPPPLEQDQYQQDGQAPATPSFMGLQPWEGDSTSGSPAAGSSRRLGMDQHPSSMELTQTLPSPYAHRREQGDTDSLKRGGRKKMKRKSGRSEIDELDGGEGEEPDEDGFEEGGDSSRSAYPPPASGRLSGPAPATVPETVKLPALVSPASSDRSIKQQTTSDHSTGAAFAETDGQLHALSSNSSSRSQRQDGDQLIARPAKEDSTSAKAAELTNSREEQKERRASGARGDAPTASSSPVVRSSSPTRSFLPSPKDHIHSSTAQSAASSSTSSTAASMRSAEQQQQQPSDSRGRAISPTRTMVGSSSQPSLARVPVGGRGGRDVSPSRSPTRSPPVQPRAVRPVGAAVLAAFKRRPAKAAEEENWEDMYNKFNIKEYRHTRKNDQPHRRKKGKGKKKKQLQPANEEEQAVAAMDGSDPAQAPEGNSGSDSDAHPDVLPGEAALTEGHPQAENGQEHTGDTLESLLSPPPAPASKPSSAKSKSSRRKQLGVPASPLVLSLKRSVTAPNSESDEESEEEAGYSSSEAPSEGTPLPSARTQLAQMAAFEEEARKEAEAAQAQLEAAAREAAEAAEAAAEAQRLLEEEEARLSELGEKASEESRQVLLAARQAADQARAQAEWALEDEAEALRAAAAAEHQANESALIRSELESRCAPPGSRVASAHLDPAERSMLCLLEQPLSPDMSELRRPGQPPIIAVPVGDAERMAQLMQADISHLHSNPAMAHACSYCSFKAVPIVPDPLEANSKLKKKEARRLAQLASIQNKKGIKAYV